MKAIKFDNIANDNIRNNYENDITIIDDDHDDYDDDDDDTDNG